MIYYESVISMQPKVYLANDNVICKSSFHHQRFQKLIRILSSQAEYPTSFSMKVVPPRNVKADFFTRSENAIIRLTTDDCENLASGFSAIHSCSSQKKKKILEIVEKK